MNKAAILEKLNRHCGEILDRFGAKHLSLFGSAARDELRDYVLLTCWWSLSGPRPTTATST